MRMTVNKKKSTEGQYFAWAFRHYMEKGLPTEEAVFAAKKIVAAFFREQKRKAKK